MFSRFHSNSLQICTAKKICWYNLNNVTTCTEVQVEYFERPELPGKRFFKCDAKRAVLQVSACSALWMESQRKGSDGRHWMCQTCSIGAEHSGAGGANCSKFYRKPICARCGLGTSRMVNGHLCVSCANRAYEYLKGRNARGSYPVRHPELFQIALRYRSDGKNKIIRKGGVTGSIELIFAALRDDPKQPKFAFMAKKPELPEGMSWA